MEYSILAIILTTIAIATLINIILRRFDIPTAIGYIITGTVIGQIFSLNHQTHNELLQEFAEFGIVFLMFTIGLEFSVKHLKAMKKEVFLFGLLQVVVTGNMFGAFLHQIVGLELKSAIIIGYSLSLSSTAIVLKILTERGEIHSGYGRVVLGILLFQDIAVIPILLMLTIFTNPSNSVEEMLFQTLIGMVALLFVIFIFGKYILEKFLAWTLSVDSEEIFLIAALMIVIGSSYLAHILGFSYSLGAFLAGMTLAETKYKYRIEADLLTFRDIFLGIFFVTIGMQIDPHIFMEYGLLIPLFVVGVMIAKALILYFILTLFIQKRTAFKSALSLMQVGEFALAIFAIAIQNRLLDTQTTQILILTIVFSMIVTPFVINNIKVLADRFVPTVMEKELNIVSSGYSNHIIVCGYGPIAKKITKHLQKLSIPYIVVEHDNKLVEEAKKDGIDVILANAASHTVMKTLGAKDAIAIIVAIENPAKTRMVVDTITTVAPNIHTVVAVKNHSHQQIIETFAVDSIINASELIAEAIIQEALKCKLNMDITQNRVIKSIT